MSNLAYASNTNSEISFLNDLLECHTKSDNFLYELERFCKDRGVYLNKTVQDMLTSPALFDARVVSSVSDLWSPVSEDAAVKLPKDIATVNNEIADFVAGFLKGLSTG